jgi:hypothetical protein
VECKINIQKSVTFLYTSNKPTEKEVRKNHIHNSLKKYVVINLINGIKEFYNENSKTIKQINKKINK